MSSGGFHREVFLQNCAMRSSEGNIFWHSFRMGHPNKTKEFPGMAKLLVRFHIVDETNACSFSSSGSQWGITAPTESRKWTPPPIEAGDIWRSLYGFAVSKV